MDVYNPSAIRKKIKSLMEWRKRVHVVFDPLWFDGALTRFEAYCLLRIILKKNPNQELHVSDLTEEECKTVVRTIEKGNFSYSSARTLAARQIERMAAGRMGMDYDKAKASSIWRKRLGA